MNPWQPPHPPPSTTLRRENQIVGPRPTPLRINKDSVKIKKPPKHPVQHPPPQVDPAPPQPPNQPVIIYSVSPKPIYVEASNFLSIVQQLTGRDTVVEMTLPPAASTSSSGDPPVSPAARLAVLERTSPKERDLRRYGVSDGGVDELVGDEVDVSQMPGILSPAPANLPAIPGGMFSPMAGGEAQWVWGSNELMMSPFMSNLSFLPSPSSLLFSNSPTGEFFNIFDH